MPDDYKQMPLIAETVNLGTEGLRVGSMFSSRYQAEHYASAGDDQRKTTSGSGSWRSLSAQTASLIQGGGFLIDKHRTQSPICDRFNLDLAMLGSFVRAFHPSDERMESQRRDTQYELNGNGYDEWVIREFSGNVRE